MLLIVNGHTPMGYRIDDLDADRVGIDLLRNPFAIVPKLKDAELICKAVMSTVDKGEKWLQL